MRFGELFLDNSPNLVIFAGENQYLCIMKIIGRKEQVAELLSFTKSEQSEFVAIYGRRRVGKTFLIKNLFEKQMAFSFTALANGSNLQQLTSFQIVMQETTGQPQETPKNWLWAFKQLKDYLLSLKTDKKIVFFDELPYLDTPKSDFMMALEQFWNSWAAFRTDILLIVCGSSTSWIVNKLINNKGGLHNRITKVIRLLPFTLGECEEYLLSKGIEWMRYDITIAYMVLGGIPYYWSLLKKGKSVAQNIDYLFFGATSPLADEFGKLYSSLFRYYEKYVDVIRLLSSRKSGFDRDEIIQKLNINSGGGLSKILSELELCGFISKVCPPNSKVKKASYVLTDFYSQFYLDFLDGETKIRRNWWSRMQGSPKLNAWAGFTFEQVCIYHSRQLLKALEIGGIETNVFPLKMPDAQIDIVIERGDKAVNICEVKFCDTEYAIDKDYSNVLRRKISSYKALYGQNKTIFLTMITTFGIKGNMYSSMADNQITLEELFEK